MKSIKNISKEKYHLPIKQTIVTTGLSEQMKLEKYILTINAANAKPIVKAVQNQVIGSNIVTVVLMAIQLKQMIIENAKGVILHAKHVGQIKIFVQNVLTIGKEQTGFAYVKPVHQFHQGNIHVLGNASLNVNLVILLGDGMCAMNVQM